MGSSPLGSSPPSDVFLEAQRRAHEAQLAVWEGAADSSDEEETKGHQEQPCSLEGILINPRVH